MQMQRGDRLGPYEILEPIGAGGMGEVYSARDPRLERRVAIKVLPDSTANETSRARFEMEARSIAALSHPNICAIYDVGTEGAVQYLVMEYLEGETLQTRLERGALPPDEVVHHGVEIATALAAAHRLGIVHRDLKPANVMITKTGARLLDFGLARRSAPEQRRPGPDSEANTMQQGLTMEGMVVGTLHYMSPEQLQGLPVDQRTDIFSFGALLYEMATGEKAFAGPDRASVAAAILSSGSPTSPRRKALVPASLDGILRSCLARNVDERRESTADLARELASVRDGERVEVTASTSPRPRRFRRLAAVLGVAIGVAVLLFAGWRATRRATSRATVATVINAVAVLPFESDTREEKADFLSDAITEDLINTLSRLRDVRVIARTTAFTFKGKPLDLEQVRRLDVDAVLTGKIVSRDATLIVQADLIDTRSGAQLWGDRYVRSAGAAIAVEQEIVGHITDQIRPRLGVTERSRVVNVPTTHASAYEHYMSGRVYLSRRTAEDLQKAREEFEDALAIDPQFALAHAGIGDSYALINYQGGPAVRDEYLPKAEAAARRALEIAHDLGEAYATLGLVSYHRFHFRSAELLLRRATELSPNYASAHHWLAMTLAMEGRPAEQLAEARAAQNLDPLSRSVWFVIADALNAVGRPAALIAENKAQAEANPEFSPAYLPLGLAYESLQDYTRAAEVFAKSPEAAGGPLHLARLAAKRGERSKAAVSVRSFEELRTKSPTAISAVFLASIYAALGDKDRAFEALGRALAAREVQLGLINEPAMFGSIATDPRFAQFRERMARIEDDARRDVAPSTPLVSR